MSEIKKIDSLPKIIADCFIPLGQACRPAWWLMRYNLRYCSCPFDWLMGFSLKVVLLMLTEGTSSLLQEYKENLDWKGKWRSVSDIKNNFTILHDFPRDESVEQHIPIFQEKFKRKCDRMKRILKTYNNICFICNRNEDISEFLNFSHEILKLNSKLKINFINIKHSEHDKGIFCKTENNITIYDIYANDINKNNDSQSNPWFWIGNKDLWKKICSNFLLSQTIKYQFIGDKNIDFSLNPGEPLWTKILGKLKK